MQRFTGEKIVNKVLVVEVYTETLPCSQSPIFPPETHVKFKFWDKQCFSWRSFTKYSKYSANFRIHSKLPFVFGW